MALASGDRVMTYLGVGTVVRVHADCVEGIVYIVSLDKYHGSKTYTGTILTNNEVCSLETWLTFS